VRVYDVADLAGIGATSPVMLGGCGPGELDPLCDLIAGCIAPASWDRAGGPGTIAMLEDAGLQAIVVVHRQDVLERVETLLADLRKLRDAKPPADRSAKSSQGALPGWEAGLHAALAKCVTLDLADTPLEEALARLGKAAGANILIDRKALEDERVDLGAPITARLAGVPLRAALEIVCQPAGLKWTVEDEAFLVTTPEAGEQRDFATKVYAADAAGKDPLGNPDVDALVEGVTDAVRPESWEAQGGPACIQPFVLPDLAAVVVAHHWQAQEEVAEFLAGQRK
jgi:hypothetical protein